MKGFTRQEALDLTGISVALLTRLDENGAVVPIRRGNPKRPSVIYSAEQVVDLKIASELRPRMSLRDVIGVVQFVRDSGYFTLAFRFPLMMVGEEVVSAGLPGATYLEAAFGEKVLEVAKANNGRVTVRDLGVIGDVFTPIWESKAWGKVLDIDKRVKGTILEKR